MTESMAYLANMCIKNASSLGTGAAKMKYLTNGLKEMRPIEQNDGIRGTRSRNVADIAQGNINVAGQITVEPTPIELDRWLPFMGFSVSTITWSLTETLSDLYIRTDMTAKVYDFLTRISAWTLTLEPGKKWKLALDLVGKTLTVQSSGTSLSGSVDDLSRPYMMYDSGGGITIGGTLYDVDKLEIKCDHKIEPTFMSGQTATDLEPTDRIVTVTVQPKYTASETGLLDAAQALTSQAASLTLTNGGCSCAISFPALVADSQSVEIAARNAKLRLPLTYYAYKSSSTPEIGIVNDSSA